MPRTVTDWNAFVLGKPAHVAPDTEIGSGKDFSSAASIVIAARIGAITKEGGFDRNPGDGGANWMTIGVVQNASVSQNKQLAQIFEIGSTESYFVPGRTVCQASLSKVMIDGDSLMKAMYATLGDAAPDGPYDNMGFTNDNTVSTTNNKNYFYINLASNFFNNPLDLGFFFYDGQNDPLGAFYLKDAHIQAHQITLAAQQTVVLENISLKASQVIGLSAG